MVSKCHTQTEKEKSFFNINSIRLKGALLVGFRMLMEVMKLSHAIFKLFDSPLGSGE